MVSVLKQTDPKTKAFVWCRVSSCRLTSAARSSAERRGCCSHAWLPLYLWPTFLIVPSLCVLAQPPAATDWLYLPNVGPALQWRGAEKVEPVSILPSIWALEGQHLAGPAHTWPPARHQQTHTFISCGPQSSHFPPFHTSRMFTTPCHLSTRPPFSLKTLPPLKTTY